MKQQQQKQLKVFGYGLPLILAALGARHAFKYSWDLLSLSLSLLALSILGIAIWNKPLLAKLFGYWMKGAHFIGSMVTGIILTILYYIVFVPIACVLKLRGKDFMNRDWKKEVSSYWMVRSPQQQEYKQQF